MSASHVTYLGHATNLIELDGWRGITDPIFGRILRVFGRRYRRFPVSPASLGAVDAILISHAHYDHLDTTSLKLFDRHTPVLVPPHTTPFVARLGFSDVRELEWWRSTTVGAATITATPAAHWPGRLPWSNRTGYGGYIVEADGQTVFFAGDTGACRDYPEIGRRWNIDLAILPIGAYNPEAFRANHLSPEDALDAFEQLGAAQMIPIHWGVFRLSREPMAEPPQRLLDAARERGLSQRVHVLQPGQSITIHPTAVPA